MKKEKENKKPEEKKKTNYSNENREVPISPIKNNRSKQGKLNRASGRRFEAKVRAGLEKMGWII